MIVFLARNLLPRVSLKGKNRFRDKARSRSLHPGTAIRLKTLPARTTILENAYWLKKKVKLVFTRNPINTAIPAFEKENLLLS